MGRTLRIAATCSWAVCTVAVGTIAIAVLGEVTTEPARSQEEPFPPAGFFTGSYVVVGQRTDGAPYSGTARIEATSDEAMTIVRDIDGAVIREVGRITSLAPLMDTMVLDIHGDNGMIDGSCLWSVDLDNYPRLTCLRRPAPGGNGDPGYEALFPRN